MSLRWKFAISLGALAAVAAIAASVVGYAATRSQLYSQIDSSLRDAGAGARHLAVEGRLNSNLIRPGRRRPPGPAGAQPPVDDDGFGGADPETRLTDRLFITQQIDRQGEIVVSDPVALPVDNDDRAVAVAAATGAMRPGSHRIRDAKVGKTSIRIETWALPGGGAVQVARSLADADSTLENLRDRLIFLTITIVALAALIGLFLANRATRSLEDLTEAAEGVAATGTPNADINVQGDDEIGRLGRSLSRMLASLAESREQQQRFVQDAGHELRTPLTSMTTNLAVLDQLDRLSPEDRKRLLDDLRSETAEMSSLVNELVELTDGSAGEDFREVDLVEVVKRTSNRASRRSGRQVVITGEGATVHGQQRGLERAVGNLIDNAIKFDTSDGPIEVNINGTSIVVADRGPGIEPGEETKIFDRFHRSVEARNVPGSGLGLSIVQQIVERHGGSTSAQNRDGGGAEIGFVLGDSAADED
jgi:two-component system sensor histidine kinase MprB